MVPPSLPKTDLPNHNEILHFNNSDGKNQNTPYSAFRILQNSTCTFIVITLPFHLELLVVWVAFHGYIMQIQKQAKCS